MRKVLVGALLPAGAPDELVARGQATQVVAGSGRKVVQDAVDWEKTDAYADSARAARYAGTRGPDDFALLSNAVTVASG